MQASACTTIVERINLRHQQQTSNGEGEQRPPPHRQANNTRHHQPNANPHHNQGTGERARGGRRGGERGGRGAEAERRGTRGERDRGDRAATREQQKRTTQQRQKRRGQRGEEADPDHDPAQAGGLCATPAGTVQKRRRSQSGGQGGQ